MTRRLRAQPSVIVRMALVALRGAMAVAVVVMAMAVVVMGMIMAATAALAMGVMVVMHMGVLMTMVVVVAVLLMAVVLVAVMMAMVMIVVAVVVMVVAAAAIVAMMVVMHLRLRLERTLDRRHGTALPAHQLGDGGHIDDVERVGRHFRRDVVAAEMPGETHQPQRVLGANLQQALQRSLDLDQAAILQLQSVAIVEHCGLVEIDRELQAARRLHRQGAAAAILVPEAERVDDALGADGGLANDGSGAKHVR